MKKLQLWKIQTNNRKLSKELEIINNEMQTAEKQIDTIVYNLYKLSEKDIAMIEKEMK